MEKFLTTHFPKGVPNQPPKKGDETSEQKAKRFFGLFAEACKNNNETPLSVMRSDCISAYTSIKRFETKRKWPEPLWLIELLKFCQKVALRLRDKGILAAEEMCYKMLYDCLRREPFDEEKMICFFDELSDLLSKSSDHQHQAAVAA